MKRGTVGHPKLKLLARLLKLPPYAAVGLLESLWHLTAEQHPRGDVGRWRDELIAEGVGWDRDPQEPVLATPAVRK